MNQSPESTALNKQRTLAPCGAGRVPGSPRRAETGGGPC